MMTQVQFIIKNRDGEFYRTANNHLAVVKTCIKTEENFSKYKGLIIENLIRLLKRLSTM